MAKQDRRTEKATNNKIITGFTLSFPLPSPASGFPLSSCCFPGAPTDLRRSTYTHAYHFPALPLASFLPLLSIFGSNSLFLLCVPLQLLYLDCPPHLYPVIGLLYLSNLSLRREAFLGRRRGGRAQDAHQQV